MPVALMLYLLIFLITSIFSLIGGTSASASSQQTTHSQNQHAASSPSIVIGGVDTTLSNLLDCTTSTTTTTNSDGTATSTPADSKYIAGGSPTPTCQNGHWACQHGGSTVDDYVPGSVPKDKDHFYVVCFGAGNLANPWFDPTQISYPSLDGCNPNAKYSFDAFVKTKDADVLPICADVAGIAGKTWICPIGYKVAFTAYGVETVDFFDPLQCQPNNSNWIFPCSDVSDGLPNVSVIQKDWLSGNHPGVLSSAELTTPTAGEGGRFFYTFPEDTFKLDGVTKLMPYTLGIGLIFLSPVIVLIGYQVLLGSITFRYANALQAIPRLLLGIAIIVVAFTMTETLIAISNNITGGLILLHKDLGGFPTAMVNNQPVAYTLANENDLISYRGMVVPMSRWGCAANEFMKILAAKFVTDVLASIIPIFGNLIHLVATIANFFDLIKHLGQFILLVLSIMLWAQVLVRIVLLNYYILLCPIAFGCWALPGGFGQGVVNQWAKGFFSTLLIQIVQVFVITTLPLVIPVLPAIPSDSLGLMKGLLTQLPPILVLWMTVRAPSILGTSTARAITNAGSIAGGVVTAVGATAYNMV
ncbi:hypothetical protein KSF_064190 [Reticulibacter mediterranei]|uniref:Uncharacterized protein n=1 Tax=Reticulibacter mediterranei TaxID=2778369 RepID=A0A8J3IKV7_9CHLR|nr:hypothetical protein [Reticulibacter mediterranei]GHO96371.1 hypothetical protein KSF_064190 [Reticulibacter mediterranei]